MFFKLLFSHCLECTCVSAFCALMLIVGWQEEYPACCRNVCFKMPWNVGGWQLMKLAEYSQLYPVDNPTCLLQKEMCKKGRYSSSWEPHLRDTRRHLPYGITQCYLPPDTSERTPPNPSHTGWYSSYLPLRDGRLSWPSVKNISLSHKDAQDKEDRRLRIKGAASLPRITWKMAIKMMYCGMYLYCVQCFV